ncbi:protein cordon-bleu isoform X2 [Scyliorhinus canicula]|uniref:protein cordon-bleu isoform X2 n=1 Tax=Scyliorhinus canicula TaxID=7830 RepID=UPI0018F79D4C|nr:protein cordon-bleu isoform X2 [Scyliorhinus canicula]
MLIHVLSRANGSTDVQGNTSLGDAVQQNLDQALSTLRMKGRAPLPPPQPAPRRIPTATQNCKVEHTDQNPGDVKENVLPGTMDLLVFLPNGAEITVKVNESKAAMDLLIDLCSQYHLNPTHHTLELQSKETHKPLGFKPNTAVGVLEIDKVFIKQKVIEEKPRRPPPVVPEKTVRLVVNFLRTQKTVVRVNPLVPLRDLLPVICEKCDFNSDHLVLLKDNIRREKVDLSKSLSDLETRELYALDSSRELSQSALSITGMNDKEEKGLLGFFKLGKKKTKGYSTAPSTPTVTTRSTNLNPSLSANNILKISQMTDIKKRRAPPPPSVPPEHSSIKIVDPSVQEIGAESLNFTQKKRHAPPPPPRMPNTFNGTDFERNTFAGLGSEQGSGVGGDIMEIEPGNREETASVKSSDNFHRSFSEYPPIAEDELLNADDSETENSQSDGYSTVTLTGCLNLRNKTATKEIPHASCKVSGTEDYSTWSSDQSSEEESNSSGNYKNSTGSNWKGEVELSSEAQIHLTLAELDTELAAGQELDFKKYSTMSDRTIDEQEAVPVTIIDEVSSTCYEEVEENILLEKVPKPTAVKEVHDPDRSWQTNSKTMTRTFVTSINEQSPSDVAFDTFYPASIVSCTDIKKSIEGLQGGVSNAQEKIKSGENKFEMILPAIELKYDVQVKGNGRKELHNIEPVEVDPITLEAGHSVEIVKNVQAEHVMQAENCSTANSTPKLKLSSGRWRNTDNKITNEYLPKVGMRTFTVVPPKPVVKPKGREGLSLTTGAIKIDDLGNLIHTEIGERKNKETSANSTASDKESLLGKAKTFWNVKNMDKDNLQCANSTTNIAINTIGCTAGRLQLQEPAKLMTNISPKFEAVIAETTAISNKSLKIDSQSTEEKPFASVMPLNVKFASIPENTDPKIESNFIKPCRRTSSQYVALAICRYTGIQSIKTGAGNKSNAQSNTGFVSKFEDKHKFRSAEEKSSLKPSQKNRIGSQLNAEFTPPSNCSTESVGKMIEHEAAKPVSNQNWLIKEVSNQTSSYNKITSQSQLSPNKQCCTANRQIPRSTLSSPFVKDVNSSASSAQSIKTLKTFTSTPSLTSFSDSVQNHAVTMEQSDCISHNLPASNLPTMSATVSSDTETAFAIQSEPSPSFHTNCFNVKPNTNMFGPVKKFKPIIQKPIQKDECLHSSLMDAIQSGQNKERLKKISDTVRNDNLKKTSLTATENEHSALLASIRAHSGISKLKKITSTISKELHDVTSECCQTRQPATTSSHVRPPAPPPDFPKTEKFTTKPVANLEEARSALLEAIQSGTGASRLRKVNVARNTMQINGRTSCVKK